MLSERLFMPRWSSMTRDSEIVSNCGLSCVELASAASKCCATNSMVWLVYGAKILQLEQLGWERKKRISQYGSMKTQATLITILLSPQLMLPSIWLLRVCVVTFQSVTTNYPLQTTA